MGEYLMGCEYGKMQPLLTKLGMCELLDPRNKLAGPPLGFRGGEPVPFRAPNGKTIVAGADCT